MTRIVRYREGQPKWPWILVAAAFIGLLVLLVKLWRRLRRLEKEAVRVEIEK